MFGTRVRSALLVAIAALSFAATAADPSRAAPAAATPPAAAPEPIPTEVCLGCHGSEGFSAPAADGSMRNLHISEDRFRNSTHGPRQCQGCHTDITEIPHNNIGKHQVGCVECHRKMLDEAVKSGNPGKYPKLQMVDNKISHFMQSIHARPNMKDQSRTNATCYNCHNAHYIYPPGTKAYSDWKATLPDVCGNCHKTQMTAFKASVHGKEQAAGNRTAPVCSDCHTSHDISETKASSTKSVITQNCGNCHKNNFDSYLHTYHGQVNKLGYTYTAKCYDCHGSHDVLRAKDPASKVSPANRLNTCKQCHKQASEGFLTFQPHGTPKEPNKYPLLWFVKTFMDLLLIGVFGFFWTHVVLWLHREYKDRKEHKHHPHVRVEHLDLPPHQQYVRRFAWGWRIAHLSLVLSVMTLVLTGMSVLFADSDWAPSVMQFLGSPRVAGFMHRMAASVFIIIFLGHLVVVMNKIIARTDGFHLMGPTSMVPNLQDLKDIGHMFKWFLGKGPRPVFERWTYWEKFDYWAVFWGVGVIGLSGLSLWSPVLTGTFLPGWVFNVATIFHGEEAVLAAVFLFTVHFFNNHFRPDKFPLDTVIFTGVMPVEEFKREHTREWNRLVKTGQLSKYLVDAPSRPLALGSRILGFTLIGIGLTLLILVIIGLLGE